MVQHNLLSCSKPPPPEVCPRSHSQNLPPEVCPRSGSRSLSLYLLEACPRSCSQPLPPEVRQRSSSHHLPPEVAPRSGSRSLSPRSNSPGTVPRLTPLSCKGAAQESCTDGRKQTTHPTPCLLPSYSHKVLLQGPAAHSPPAHRPMPYASLRGCDPLPATTLAMTPPSPRRTGAGCPKPQQHWCTQPTQRSEAVLLSTEAKPHLDDLPEAMLHHTEANPTEGDLCNQSKPSWPRKPEEIEDGEGDDFYNPNTKDKDGPVTQTHFIAQDKIKTSPLVERLLQKGYKVLLLMEAVQSTPAPPCQSSRARSFRPSPRKDSPLTATPRLACSTCRGHNLKAPCAVDSPHHVPWTRQRHHPPGNHGHNSTQTPRLLPWTPADQQVYSCRRTDFKAPRTV